jgi:hypothetical protein
VFPATRHLRCWNHKRLNVLDKLPRRLHKEAGVALSAMYAAPTSGQPPQVSESVDRTALRRAHAPHPGDRHPGELSPRPA